eukprot:SAG25_NODE_825_length_5177_cov_3.055337_2_plen_59_part_00
MEAVQADIARLLALVTELRTRWGGSYRAPSSSLETPEPPPDLGTPVKSYKSESDDESY